MIFQNFNFLFISQGVWGWVWLLIFSFEVVPLITYPVMGDMWHINDQYLYTQAIYVSETGSIEKKSPLTY